MYLWRHSWNNTFDDTHDAPTDVYSATLDNTHNGGLADDTSNYISHVQEDTTHEDTYDEDTYENDHKDMQDATHDEVTAIIPCI